MDLLILAAIAAGAYYLSRRPAGHAAKPPARAVANKQPSPTFSKQTALNAQGAALGGAQSLLSSLLGPQRAAQLLGKGAPLEANQLASETSLGVAGIGAFGAVGAGLFKDLGVAITGSGSGAAVNSASGSFADDPYALTEKDWSYINNPANTYHDDVYQSDQAHIDAAIAQANAFDGASGNGGSYGLGGSDPGTSSTAAGVDLGVDTSSSPGGGYYDSMFPVDVGQAGTVSDAVGGDTYTPYIPEDVTYSPDQIQAPESFGGDVPDLSYDSVG